MKQFFLGVIICIMALMLPTIGFGQSPQPEFSLDDHPTGPPLTGPWVAPYMSAEDEFGLGLPASVGFVDPSPSLLSINGPFFDSDILVPGAPNPAYPPTPPPILPPVLFMRFAPPPPPSPFYLDAVSCNHVSMVPCPNGIFVRFSVDRATGGATPGDASYGQAANNEQPADIYRTDRAYTHVGFFVPLPPPVMPPWYYGGPLPTAGTGVAAGAVNQLMYDHYWALGLLPAPPCPRINSGYATHDNINAFNEWPVSLATTDVFFALAPASALPAGFSPADIFVSPNPPGGLVMPGAPFAFAGQMGLDTFGFGTDSIDGIAFWDNGIPGVLEPGIDYVAFTLAPGSATLMFSPPGLGLNAADVFVTDFNGFFCTYLIAGDLGVGNLPNVASVPRGPLPVIGPTEINVDALDLTIDPDPVPYIDPVTDPNVNPQDFKFQQ